ncbi:cyclic nucleotide-binding domain-containing protein [Magnetococcus sp. PR-3]|uniref:cyclic nucleotide-binding domain-containing protein n=1 Tax=Magnetococcus sp. PR-3 TaxID=3120355 RepID=UPI002FCE1530
MTTPDTTFFSHYSLFRDVKEEDLAKLIPLMPCQTYKSGEIVFAEGSDGRELYLIESGSVEVLKNSGSKAHVIAELPQGSHFGELSFLDGSPRSTAIRAKTDLKLYTLRKRFLDDDVCTKSMIQTLYRNLSLTGTARLRSTDIAYSEILEKELVLHQEKEYINRFLITVIASYSSVLVLFSMLQGIFKDVDVYSTTFTWLFVVLIVLPVLYFTTRSGEPWASFGVTLTNWKRSVIEGLLISFGVMFVGLNVLYLAAYLGLMPKTTTTMSGIVHHIFIGHPVTLFYFVHSYAQEFLARGVFQNTMQRVFGEKKSWKAIILSSFIFGVAHIPYGAAMVGMTVFSGIFFGYIFKRHNNLLGVSLVHWLLGTFTFLLSSLPFAEKLN